MQVWSHSAGKFIQSATTSRGLLMEQILCLALRIVHLEPARRELVMIVGVTAPYRKQSSTAYVEAVSCQSVRQKRHCFAVGVRVSLPQYIGEQQAVHVAPK